MLVIPAAGLWRIEFAVETESWSSPQDAHDGPEMRNVSAVITGYWYSLHPPLAAVAPPA